MSLLRLLIAAGVLAFPALLPATRLVAARTDAVIWAGTFALASTVFVAVAASYVHLSLFFVVWAVMAAGAIWWRIAAAPPRPAAAGDRRFDPWLIAILAIVAIPRFAVAIAHDLPPGWDPTFHLVLARKLLETGGMIHDWTPFEDVALNYPVGSHVLVAMLAMLTGLAPHTVFNLLVPLIGVLTTAQMYLLARHASGSAQVARYTAVAYGAWANWGSIDYYRWGGMPNLVGMSLLLGALTLLIAPRFDWRRRALFGLLVAAIALTHHHVMLTAGLLFGALFVHAVLRRDRERAVGLVAGLAFAFVLGAFYVVPYALKAGGIGETSVLTASEPPIPPDRLVRSVGAVLLAAGVIGVVLAAVSRSAGRPAGAIGVVTGVLAAMFVVFHYVYPALAERWTGEAYIPFTPSRFLTDLAYVLPIYAGYAAARASAAVRLPQAAAVGAMLLLGLTLLPVWRHLYTIPAIDPPLREAYTWIQQQAEPHAVVLDRGRWSVYLTWRRTATTSLPVSEPTTAGTAKRALIDALEKADPAAPRPDEAGALQILAIRPRGANGAHERVLWRHPSGLTVVELWPRR